MAHERTGNTGLLYGFLVLYGFNRLCILNILGLNGAKMQRRLKDSSDQAQIHQEAHTEARAMQNPGFAQRRETRMRNPNHTAATDPNCPKDASIACEVRTGGNGTIPMTGIELATGYSRSHWALTSLTRLLAVRRVSCNSILPSTLNISSPIYDTLSGQYAARGYNDYCGHVRIHAQWGLPARTLGGASGCCQHRLHG